MKKFWRSGMIDKKVIVEREREEYINKLYRTILELSREEEEEPKYATFYTSDNRSFKRKIPREKPLTPTQSAKKGGEGIANLFTNDYDEVRIGDNVILDFGGENIIVAPRGSLKDIMHYESHSYNRKTTRENINDWLSEQMRNRSEYNTFKGED